YCLTGSRHHLYLHSFPTRRSSDLLIVAAYNVVFIALVVRVVASWFGRFRYTWWLRPAYVLTDWVVEPIRRLLPPGGALDWSPLRSEEHTSELQSRGHLVCRLLLEK